jgi:putative membrane-bound dehydrogenase-like protein
MRRALPLSALWLLAALCHAAEPRVLVDGYELELVAREPDIVTPIGMTFDSQGRLLVIESHTHQRPDDYEGPPGDRIRMLADSDGDGRLDRWSTFAEGFQQSMNLCAHPDGGVYLVTRRDVRLLEDTNDDGAADQTTEILRLETDADYPHNGLSGIALRAADDELFIGLGENFGVAYKLVGSDGASMEGSGGVGTIFCCTSSGAKLQRIAVGFWNPFSICLAGEAVFCVDNDPDASPPCRLISVLPAGDYGHRWEYGRAGVHPLQAWNGELPGTLPMVCGTGEAPTALLHHRGYLWVTSWGDHRIERYAASVERKTSRAAMDIVVQGDADFRPTGAAIAPDGSLYFADWVDRSYPVHGKGRIWRLEVPRGERTVKDKSEGDGPIAWEQWSPKADARQFFIFAGKHDGGDVSEWRTSTDPKLRLAAQQSDRWLNLVEPVTTIQSALGDPDADVRLYAVRWIADERIAELRDEVAKLLDGDIPNERYFLAVLAAIEWLDGDAEPRTSGISDGLLRRELANDSRSTELHALALRLISPDHEWLTLERLRGYLASPSPALRLEAVRTLAMQTNPERLPLLAELAADGELDAELRAEAVTGLAVDVAAHATLLEQLATDDDDAASREAQRVLRLSRRREPAVDAPADAEHPDPADLDAWDSLLADGGDDAEGRRLFFMPGPGPQCAACHQHGGRGGRVGPDLTLLGRQQAPKRIIASILQPSREIAPHYQAWTLLTTDGLSRVALRLPKGGDDGVERYADPQGREFTLPSEEIELRSPSELSIMPDGLERTLSVDDLRDLVAFLTAASAAPK